MTGKHILKGIGETTGGARHPLEFECVAVRYEAMNDERMN